MFAQANTGLGGDVNILEAMEMFKSVPDQVLPKYAQDPKLAIFAAAEMARRDDMRKRYQQRAQKPNKPVVAQLAESIAPSMPAMPPGMNAPQQQPQMQMAPSQMQPQMQQQMQPQMQQPQQPGIASLMPQQSFAGGGPVAFSTGDLVNSSLSQEELEEMRRRARQSGFVPAQDQDAMAERLRIQEELDRPYRPPNPMARQAARQQEYRNEKAYPEEAAETRRLAQRSQAASEQSKQPQRQPLVIPLQQAPSAPQPMGIEQILALGKKANLPGINIPEPYETAGRADQLYKERQGRFPDEISPIMQQLKEFYGKQPTQADIDKAANRQIALSMMGSKDRNFLSGLAGGLQAGEDVKRSMGAENRAAQQASLQAQLAHAKYQDAIRRGDYDAAQKAAQEERRFSIESQKLRRDVAAQDLGLGIDLARAMQPKGTGEKPINPLQASKEAREIFQMPKVQAEIKAIEEKYEAMAKPTFGFGGTGIGGSIPENWKAPGVPGKPSLGDKMRAEQEAVIRRYAQMFGFPGQAGVFTPSNEQVQAYARRGAQ